jgi:hypothetical protein
MKFFSSYGIGKLYLLAILGVFYLIGYNTPFEKHLAIFGLLSCLAGTIVCFFSVQPYENDSEEIKKTDTRKTMAFLNEGLAETGIFLIFIGFLIQLISAWLTKNG